MSANSMSQKTLSEPNSQEYIDNDPMDYNEGAMDYNEGGCWKNELNEIDDSDKSLSIIMYGSTKDLAYECAEKLFGKRIEEGKDVWKKTVQGETVFGYTRWYECEGQIKPKSPVYGFYFYIANDGQNKNDLACEFICDKFLSDSTRIPDDCKLYKIVDDNDHGLEIQYLAKLGYPAFSNKIFENVLANHNNMKKIFGEIDGDKSGVLDAKEVMTLLNLDQNSDKEMAEEYLKEISDKDVTFDRFRNWFLQRKDFNDITYMVAEKMDGLAQAKKFSTVFKACEEEIKQMTEEEKAKEFNSMFAINPSKEIIRGIDLELNLQAGDKIQTLINSVHDFAKEEDFLVIFRIGAKNEEAGKTLKTTLEMLKGMAFGAIGELKNKISI